MPEPTNPSKTNIAAEEAPDDPRGAAIYVPVSPLNHYTTVTRCDDRIVAFLTQNAAALVTEISEGMVVKEWRACSKANRTPFMLINHHAA